MNKTAYILRNFIKWKNVLAFNITYYMVIYVSTFFNDMDFYSFMYCCAACVMFCLIGIGAVVCDLWNIIRYPPNRIE